MCIRDSPRTVLDQLRQPLEDGAVQISRCQQSTVFPALIALVAATMAVAAASASASATGSGSPARSWIGSICNCGWNGVPLVRWQQC